MIKHSAHCFTYDIDTTNRPIDQLSDEIELLTMLLLVDHDHEYQQVDHEKPWTLKNNIIRSKRYYKLDPGVGHIHTKIATFWTCVPDKYNYRLALRIKLYVVTNTMEYEDESKCDSARQEGFDEAINLSDDIQKTLAAHEIKATELGYSVYATDSYDDLWDNKVNTALEYYYNNTFIGDEKDDKD